MKKKQILTTAAAVALTATVCIGGTLAYLSSVTETKTNTFSSSKNIETIIEEKNFDPDKASNYTPGKVIAKNPTITNESTSNENAWIAMSVDYTNGAFSISADEFNKYATIDGKDTQNWRLIARSEAGQELYMYKNSLAPGATTSALFTGLTVNAGITEVKKSGTTGSIIYTKDAATGKLLDVKDNTEIVASTKYYDATGKELAITAADVKTTLPTFVINAKGYAVQKSQLDESKAADELIALAKNSIGANFTKITE